MEAFHFRVRSPAYYRQDKLAELASKNEWDAKRVYYDSDGRFFDKDPDIDKLLLRTIL